MKKTLFILSFFFYFFSPSFGQDLEVPKLPDFWYNDPYWKDYARNSVIHEAIRTLSTPDIVYWNQGNIDRLIKRLEVESIFKRQNHSPKTSEYVKQTSELEKICGKLINGLEKIREYTVYECSIPVHVYRIPNKDFKKLDKYNDVLYQKYKTTYEDEIKNIGYPNLTVKYWETILSQEDQAASQSILDKMNEIWKKRRTYILQLEMHWEQRTDKEATITKMTFSGDNGKLESQLNISLFFLMKRSGDYMDVALSQPPQIPSVRYPTKKKLVQTFSLFTIAPFTYGDLGLRYAHIRSVQLPKGLDYAILVDAPLLKSEMKQINKQLDEHLIFGKKK